MYTQDIGLSHDVPPYRLHRLGVVMRADPNNPDEVLGVLNPATARGPDSKLYLFARIVAAGNYSRIGIAEVVFDAQGDPVEVKRMGYALEPTEPYERNARTAGCEDPRITFVEPLGYYVMTYTAYGPLGPRVALARSTDLLTWQRIGPVKFAFMPRYRVDFDLYDNKDAYLFPKPVRDPRGRPALAMIHRPSNTQGGLQVTPEGIAEPRASMWISYCPLERAEAGPEALLTWEEHQLLATPAQPWESLKIGGGTPPVLTSRGWLTIYHGVSGRIVEGVDHQPFVRYCAGVLVLDRDDPRRVIYRSSEPILSPEAPEEKTGVVANVVFPTGVDVREGGRLDVYYGMADFYIGVARMTLPD
ncbi:MAG: glycosidase [Anaerolineae bacterium]|nr:glycosidase [Anaerolineae bacterium]